MNGSASGKAGDRRDDRPSPANVSPDRRTDDPIGRARRIDAVCQAFEQDWRRGKPVRIEHLADRCPEDEREALVQELVALELSLRQHDGETPDLAEYRARFPGATRQIDADLTPLRAHSESFIERCGRFGHYEISGVIARGGMGVIYRAFDTRLKRDVALKTILVGAFASEEERHRFRTEAEAAARLDHPNVVPIYDVGEIDGVLYYSMKLVKAGTLSERIQRDPPSPVDCAVLVEKLARGIAGAHALGIIHRDLKPLNVLIDDRGEPVIVDFGLARRLDGASITTHPGAILGTPAYMAPEQASGEPVNATADLYSLGTILYELLTGKPPLKGPTLHETIQLLLHQEPTPPRMLVRGVPRELERICLRCLEKRPDKRYQSAIELADDLARWQRGDELSTASRNHLDRLRRWGRRRPEIAARLAGQVAITLITQINFFLRETNPRPAIHWTITSFELLWIVATIALSSLEHPQRPVVWFRAIWSLLDVILLTALLEILDAAGSSLIVGYALLIVASGFWNRASLVALTTALSVLGYALLLASAHMRDLDLAAQNRPSIVIPALILLGVMLARQVRRCRIDQETKPNPARSV